MAKPSTPPLEDRVTFGEFLKQRRKILGLSQEEAAEKAGISRQQWLRIEDGQSSTTQKTVIGLALALNLPESEVTQQAGFSVQREADRALRLGRRLVRHLENLPIASQDKAEEALERMAEALSAAV